MLTDGKEDIWMYVMYYLSCVLLLKRVIHSPQCTTTTETHIGTLVATIINYHHTHSSQSVDRESKNIILMTANKRPRVLNENNRNQTNTPEMRRNTK